MHRANRLLAALLAAAVAGGCSGGAMTTPPARPTAAPAAPAAAPSGAPASSARVRVALVVDGSAEATLSARRRARAGARAPSYVSPSTLGIRLLADGTSSAAYDVSAGSNLCSSGAPRTCTFSVLASAGAHSFTLETYDAAPSAGAIPTGAHLLGTSTVAQTIYPNQGNTLVFYIAGEVATIGAATGFASLPADGNPRTVGVTVLAQDAQGNTIAPGAHDQFANPIALALAESGSSGHAQLVVNGSAAGTSATLSRASDTVAIAYDGAGAPGYTATVAATAASSSGFTFRLSPLFVAGARISNNAATFAAAGQATDVTVTEANAPASVSYSASISGCAPNATLGAASGSGASYVSSLSDVNAPANGAGCSVAVADNLGSTIVVPVTFPVPTQDCADAAAGTQITPSSVGNGTPCPLVVTPSTLTLYSPSDGSHPGSGTITIAERNTYSLGYSSSGSCGGVANLSSATTGGGGLGNTETITISATAAGPPNVSCTYTANDSSRSQVGTIVVDPASATTTLASGPVSMNDNVGQTDVFVPVTFPAAGTATFTMTLTRDSPVPSVPQGGYATMNATVLSNPCTGSPGNYSSGGGTNVYVQGSTNTPPGQSANTVSWSTSIGASFTGCLQLSAHTNYPTASTDSGVWSGSYSLTFQ